jgi:hypothetical protein
MGVEQRQRGAPGADRPHARFDDADADALVKSAGKFEGSAAVRFQPLASTEELGDLQRQRTDNPDLGARRVDRRGFGSTLL